MRVDLRRRQGPAARDRRLRARAPRAGGGRELHPQRTVVVLRGRRCSRGAARRSTTTRRAQEPVPGTARRAAVRRPPHARLLFAPAGRPERVPALGVRVRRARPGAQAGGPLARRGARTTACSRSASSSRRASRRSRSGSSSSPSSASSSTPTRDWADELIAPPRGDAAASTRSTSRASTAAEFGSPPDPELYTRIAEAFPDAWIEDPALTPGDAAALADAPRPDHLGRRDPRVERRRGAAVQAALPEQQAVSVRLGPAALRLLRRVREARDRAVRRRPVRARPGPRPDPVARLDLPRRRTERRGARRLQRARARRRAAAEPARRSAPSTGF